MLSVSAEGTTSIEREIKYKIQLNTSNWQQVTLRRVINATGCTRGMRRVLLEKPETTRQVNNATTPQAKNAYGGPGGVPLLILTLGTGRRRVVSFKQGLFTPGRKAPHNH